MQPDIAVFAKAMGNGHPMAAIIGRRNVMQAAQDSFISSTYWTEGVGPTAALGHRGKMQRVDVPEHLAAIGPNCARVFNGLPPGTVPLKLSGYPALTYLNFDHPDASALQTLLTVRMLRHGFLADAQFYPCLVHEPRHVDDYLAAAEEVFSELGRAMREGDAAKRIGGPVRHSGFTRLA